MFLGILCHDTRNNPHPARGRKLVCPLYRIPHTGNNPHPARGRKRCTDRHVFRGDRNNPHPARGRKQTHIIFNINFFETTHTPQGDGNLFFMICSPFFIETTHTPQGDGNPLHCLPCPTERKKQPTPRKGTETVLLRKIDDADVETTHTPQGDGNKIARIS